MPLRKNILENSSNVIILGIITLGFLLRFIGAVNLPLNSDERGDAKVARQISFTPGKLSLPLVEKDSEDDAGTLSHRYLIRLGWYLFGESNLGARLPFVILGTCTIFVTYIIVKLTLGVPVALLASFLLSIDQFHIGISRVTDYNSPHLLFVVLSLSLFYRALSTSSNKLFILNSLVLGLGFWVKETMLFLIPIYIIYLFFYSGEKKYFKNKWVWGTFLSSFLIMLIPVLLIISVPDLPRIKYIIADTKIGLSLNALSLYLGELILVIIKPLKSLFEYVVVAMSTEIPTENFIFGIVILFSVIHSFRSKNTFIKLLLVCFLFNFLIFSIIRKIDRIDSIWSLSSFTWSSLGFIPGIIIASYTIIIFIRKYFYSGTILLFSLILFMFIRTWDIVTYPIPAYFPARNFCIWELQSSLDVLGFPDSDKIRSITDVRLLKSVYLVAQNRPEYKQAAALRIAEIMIQRGSPQEAWPYLYSVFLRDPDNEEAVNLGKRILSY